MPQIVYQDSFITIWSFMDDVKIENHFIPIPNLIWRLSSKNLFSSSMSIINKNLAYFPVLSIFLFVTLLHLNR